MSLFTTRIIRSSQSDEVVKIEESTKTPFKVMAESIEEGFKIYAEIQAQIINLRPVRATISLPDRQFNSLALYLHQNHLYYNKEVFFGNHLKLDKAFDRVLVFMIQQIYVMALNEKGGDQFALAELQCTKLLLPEKLSQDL